VDDELEPIAQERRVHGRIVLLAFSGETRLDVEAVRANPPGPLAS
jgi:hypothetical protein